MTTASTPSSRAPDRAEPGSPALAVLIADKFEPSGVDGLRGLGCRVDLRADLTADDLPAAVASADPHVLIVRSTKVREPVFEAAHRLSLVIRAGAGYDNIDVKAASARGVFVANCPGKNALAVAELTWALILACDRRVPDQTADLRAGRWDKKGYGKARGLHGRTLGIVGLGRIGEAVVARARAFGMRTIAWSRSLTPESAEALDLGYCASPIDVAREADVVSLHVASTPETKHLAGAEFFDAMRDGAILVNTSRGAVVDADALARAIEAKGIRAGLDVFGRQPAPGDASFDDPIINAPGVYGTHHCGASTDQAQQAIAAETVRIVEEYVGRGIVPNCINLAGLPAACLLTVRHLNRAGVLAHVFSVLSEAAINVEEMENVIYEGAKAACARIELASTPSDVAIDAIRRNDNILSVGLTDVSPGTETT
jgi:D-3-phosphoglycerate dehydrogenase